MGQAKGTAMVDVVKFLRREKARAQKLLPDHLHHYLTERVNISTWYPEDDLLELIKVGKRLFPSSVKDPLMEMGLFVSMRHLSGVYTHLKTAPDLQGMWHRGLALWSSIHDTGRLTVTSEGPRLARIELRDFEDSSPEMCGIVRGYIAGVFSASGLVDPIVKKIACVLRGADLCAWTCTWSESLAQN